MAFRTGYNKMSVYGSGKSISFAAGDYDEEVAH